MLVRTKLVPVAGIASSYDDPDKPGEKLDVSKLTAACLLTPDTNRALHRLDGEVQQSGGKLYISDMFRSWDVQAKAHTEWSEGKRKDYVAPPGKSFHMAGRAIDIDLDHLGFNESKEHWLDIFWGIALPIGWEPIVNDPKMNLSEAWHFQFLGDDWQHMKADDGEVAQCAILDAGKWDQKDPKLQNMFLQAQLNRLSEPRGFAVLRVDGEVGPKTISAIRIALGQSYTVQTAIEMLIQL